MADEIGELKNGEVWKSWGAGTAIMQYVVDRGWMLLSAPDKGRFGQNVMLPISEPKEPYRDILTTEDMKSRLITNGWKRCPDLEIRLVHLHD